VDKAGGKDEKEKTRGGRSGDLEFPTEGKSREMGKGRDGIILHREGRVGVQISGMIVKAGLGGRYGGKTNMETGQTDKD